MADDSGRYGRIGSSMDRAENYNVELESYGLVDLISQVLARFITPTRTVHLVVALDKAAGKRVNSDHVIGALHKMADRDVVLNLGTRNLPLWTLNRGKV